MKRNILISVALIGFTVMAFAISAEPLVAQQLTDVEELGKSIFFDNDLSINGNQSCAACHGPAAGWTGPETDINAGGAVYEGSVEGRFGNRKPPSSAYEPPARFCTS